MWRRVLCGRTRACGGRHAAGPRARSVRTLFVVWSDHRALMRGVRDVALTTYGMVVGTVGVCVRATREILATWWAETSGFGTRTRAALFSSRATSAVWLPCAPREPPPPAPQLPHAHGLTASTAPRSCTLDGLTPGPTPRSSLMSVDDEAMKVWLISALDPM